MSFFRPIPHKYPFPKDIDRYDFQGLLFFETIPVSYHCLVQHHCHSIANLAIPSGYSRFAALL